MASITDKVKHVLHMDKSASSTHTTGHTGTAEGVVGPHSSRAANAADPRIDSDRDGSHNLGANGHNTTHNGLNGGHTGTGVGHTGTGVGHTGTGVGHTGHNGTAEGVAGPHSSRVANAADPRVDSDRDGSHNTHSHNTTTGGLGGVGHTGPTSHSTTTTAGPHNSNLLNKADPRVDSDRSNQYGATGTHNTHGAGVGTGIGHNGTTTHSSTTTAGPHNSNLLNKADPRVDSDRSNQYGTSHTNGTHGTTGTGIGHNTHNNTTGTGIGHNTHNTTGVNGGISHSTNAGPHNSNALNKADPRVDSDRDGRANQHGTTHGGVLGSGTHATPGSGTAQNTAGPHNSDLLNKLDPRVDSNLDGSKTVGGNKTHA